MKVRLLFFAVLYVIAFVLLLTSCRKELPLKEITPEDVKTMDALVVEPTFDFKTTHTVRLKITTPESVNLPASKIEVFNGNPNQNGELIKTGITNASQRFETTLTVPNRLSEIYVRRTAFDNQLETVTLDIDSDVLEYAFTSSKSGSKLKSSVAGPGCSDCDETIDKALSGRYTLDKGKTVCIVAGGSFTGDLDLNKGTLIVCGSLTLNSLKGEGHIIINDEGVFTATSLNINRREVTITNYGNAFRVSAAPALNGVLENYGIMSFPGVSINGGELINYGTLNLSGDLNNNNYCYNGGSLIVSANINHNNGNFVNECRTVVSGNLSLNSEAKNASFMQVTGMVTVNKGPFLFSGQALLETSNISVNALIEAEGDEYSKIDVASESRINSSGTLTGKLNFWDENGVEGLWGTFGREVTFDNAYIPASFCSPGSNIEGGVSLIDTDSDGVSDEFDEYPEDANKAFNNVYPSSESWGVLAFEDLWPYSGDYDFNDFVLAYQINQITNANDKIVELGIVLKMQAIGASFKNGFGIQLPVNADAVSIVSGDFSFTQGGISLDVNNTERNQDKAVVIFFDNAFSLLPHPGVSTGVNTTKGAPYVVPREAFFTVSFAYPVAPELMGEPPYNPFIFVDGERGREIHLKNKLPTNLAGTEYFGEGSDSGDYTSGLTYQTTNGLPWAINMVESFDYPVEKKAIIDAYAFFVSWAMSGGTEYTDWYTDQEGYRNSEFIY